jgi:hypothetical protein
LLWRVFEVERGGWAEVSRVVSGDTTNLVRATPEGYRCTCPWYASHGAGRGPCKHILAARLVAR